MLCAEGGMRAVKLTVYAAPAVTANVPELRPGRRDVEHRAGARRGFRRQVPVPATGLPTVPAPGSGFGKPVFGSAWPLRLRNANASEPLNAAAKALGTPLPPGSVSPRSRPRYRVHSTAPRSPGSYALFACRLLDAHDSPLLPTYAGSTFHTRAAISTSQTRCVVIGSTIDRVARMRSRREPVDRIGCGRFRYERS